MTRWMTLASIVVVALGVGGLVFGILLLVAGNVTHNETVREVRLDDTRVKQLKPIRELLAEQRRAEGVPLNPINQQQLNLLTMETGTALSLTNLGLATMVSYAGIAVTVLGVALIVLGATQLKLARHMT